MRQARPTVSIPPLLLLLAVLFSIGCSRTHTFSPTEIASGRLQVEELSVRFGTRTHPEVIGCWERLLAALQYSNQSCDACTLTVLTAREPWLFSTAGGAVFVAEGTLLTVTNEAELAFVLAHELAHQVLGDTSRIKDQRYDPELEERADRFAAGLVALAGYDPRYGATAIERMAAVTSTDPRTSGVAHCSAPHCMSAPRLRRSSEIERFVADSGWKAPGTVDRRAFASLRSKLQAEYGIVGERRSQQ